MLHARNIEAFFQNTMTPAMVKKIGKILIFYIKFLCTEIFKFKSTVSRYS